MHFLLIFSSFSINYFVWQFTLIIIGKRLVWSCHEVSLSQPTYLGNITISSKISPHYSSTIFDFVHNDGLMDYLSSCLKLNVSPISFLGSAVWFIDSFPPLKYHYFQFFQFHWYGWWRRFLITGAHSDKIASDRFLRKTRKN